MKSPPFARTFTVHYPAYGTQRRDALVCLGRRARDASRKFLEFKIYKDFSSDNGVSQDLFTFCHPSYLLQTSLQQISLLPLLGFLLSLPDVLGPCGLDD